MSEPETSSSQQNLSDLPPPVDMPEEYLAPPPEDEGKAGPKPNGNNGVEKSDFFSLLKVVLSWVFSKDSYFGLVALLARHAGSIIIIAIFIIITVGAIFYADDRQPLASASALEQNSTVGYKPIILTLGQYNNEIYSFSSKSGQILAYNPTTGQERQVTVLPNFDKYVWHNAGKLLIVSTDVNILGNLYLYDFTTQSPAQTLLTPRGQSLGFSQNSKVGRNLEIAWSPDGQMIAFTAESLQDSDKELYLFDQNKVQPLNTITSFLW